MPYEIRYTFFLFCQIFHFCLKLPGFGQNMVRRLEKRNAIMDQTHKLVQEHAGSDDDAWKIHHQTCPFLTPILAAVKYFYIVHLLTFCAMYIFTCYTQSRNSSITIFWDFKKIIIFSISNRVQLWYLNLSNSFLRYLASSFFGTSPQIWEIKKALE